MQFIKKHLVLAITLAVVVIGLIGELILAQVTGSNLQDAIKRRADAAEGLKQVTNHVASASQLDAYEAKVNSSLAAVEAKRARLIDDQKAALRPFQVTIRVNGENSTDEIFPFDAAQYENLGKWTAFKTAYRREMAKILAEMHATAPAVEERITNNTPVFAPTPPAYGVVPVRGAARRATTLPAEAAAKGWIYTDLDVLTGGDAQPRTAKELWQKYLRWVVVRDVVGAINATNAQAKLQLTQRQVKTFSVVNSAVKRLVSIHVSPDYALPPEANAKSANVGGGIPPFAALPDPVPGLSQHTHGSAHGDHSASPEAACEVDLSKMYCNRDYDVLRYSFTVVLPLEYLPALEQNLMANKLHTILSVEFRDADPHNGAGSGDGVGGGTVWFYGPQAIAEVTIAGQLLLLTGWERALMPDELLKALPPNVLRPEDQKRLRPEDQKGTR